MNSPPTSPHDRRERATEAITAYLHDAELSYELGTRPGEFVVALPGLAKLSTTCSLLVGDHSLSASAFVMRHPDERAGDIHRWLLRRNARLPGVAYAIDAAGDLFLVGRLPLDAVNSRTVDALLGTVLREADGSFNELLLMGFRASMQREWDWRISRGESIRNLEAFRPQLEH